MNDFFKAVKDFLTDYLPKQKRCSENTIRSYKLTLNLFVQFLREKRQLSLQTINFDKVTREVIVNFLEWLETERMCSVSSRNQRLAALRSFFGYAGLVDCVNVDTGFMVAKIPHKNAPSKIVDFLSELALAALLNQPNLTERLGLRNGFFLILMYDTGARCAELLNLRLCDIKCDAKTPTVYLTGKGNKTRIVPIMAKTVQHYKQYLKVFHQNTKPSDEDYVFYTVIHGSVSAMSHDTVATFTKKYGEAAKRECPEMPSHVHPHMLRHTRAIHLYRNGMPLELVSQFLGHTSVDTSKIYAFADTEMKRAAILKADRMLHSDNPVPPAIWDGDEDMILKLSGLK